MKIRSKWLPAIFLGVASSLAPRAASAHILFVPHGFVAGMIGLVNPTGAEAGERPQGGAMPLAREMPSMTKFYAGPDPSQIGTFPGKLVCLRCDLGKSPDAAAQCERQGHAHVLSMETDAMIHPLLAGTKEMLDRINSAELHGSQVEVHGNYYPVTGFILVDRIEKAE